MSECDRAVDEDDVT